MMEDNIIHDRYIPKKHHYCLIAARNSNGTQRVRRRIEKDHVPHRRKQEGEQAGVERTKTNLNVSLASSSFLY